MMLKEDRDDNNPFRIGSTTMGRRLILCYMINLFRMRNTKEMHNTKIHVMALKVKEMSKDQFVLAHRSDDPKYPQIFF